MSTPPVDPVAETSAHLHRSRKALFGALEGLTESDFAREIDGHPLVELLAKLAREERETAEAAHRLLSTEAQEDPSTSNSSDVPPTERQATLPPQAIHALAGARHHTNQILDKLAAEDSSTMAGNRTEALTLLNTAAEHEQLAADRIANYSSGAN